mmetsp:Transcript_39326/g.61300  ORF Transcript_39326/g.61300 Transcript_39326/m.61300 type:complete len:356 (-) Transcript_39326:279-1346(-)
MTQKMGFKDVKRLKGGIVSYVRDMKEELGATFTTESLFRGINYVFDGRVGQVVTRDHMPNSLHTSRGLESVEYTDHGNVLLPMGPDLQGDMERSRRVRECLMIAAKGTKDTAGEDGGNGESEESVTNQVDGFCAEMSTLAEPELLNQLALQTKELFPGGYHMCSGPLQGSMLTLACDMAGVKRVLELGCFTGYSALCFAAGSTVTTVVTVEQDHRALDVARKFVNKSAFGHKVQLVQRDVVDALEELAMEQQAPFDLVFLDANKKGYLKHRELVLHHNLVKVGGLVLADNVLWKGQTINRHRFGPTESPSPGRAGRDEMIAESLLEYLDTASKASQWQQVVFPFRDGLSICRRLH